MADALLGVVAPRFLVLIGRWSRCRFVRQIATSGNLELLLLSELKGLEIDLRARVATRRTVPKTRGKTVQFNVWHSSLSRAGHPDEPELRLVGSANIRFGAGLHKQNL